MILPTRETTLFPEECSCDELGFSVNCSRSSLYSIPSILPTQIRILVLEGKSISFIEKDSFVCKGLIELEIIKADFCQIRKIEFGAFNGLTILTYLSTGSNEISEIVPDTFANLSSLEYHD
jgi:Leucine-rich repeat (LRR) protein